MDKHGDLPDPIRGAYHGDDVTHVRSADKGAVIFIGLTSGRVDRWIKTGAGWVKASGGLFGGGTNAHTHDGHEPEKY